MNPTGWLDRVGGVAGAICAVHCALAGLAFGALTSSGLGFVASSEWDVAFVGIAVVVGSLAAASGWRRHRSWKPAALFAAGLGLLLIAKFGMPHEHGAGVARAIDHLVPTVLSVIGGIGLVGFHVLNARLRAACPHCGGECGIELGDAPEVSSKTADA
jgi:hypothetical protein